jgi:O-glycosyl hydrolase
MPVGIMIGTQVINVSLPADSFSTIVVPKNS